LKITPETSGEDLKPTLETSGEFTKNMSTSFQMKFFNPPQSIEEDDFFDFSKTSESIFKPCRDRTPKSVKRDSSKTKKTKKIKPKKFKKPKPNKILRLDRVADSVRYKFEFKGKMTCFDSD
jgi:hypothetical protein